MKRVTLGILCGVSFITGMQRRDSDSSTVSFSVSDCSGDEFSQERPVAPIRRNSDSTASSLSESASVDADTSPFCAIQEPLGVSKQLNLRMQIYLLHWLMRARDTLAKAQ